MKLCNCEDKSLAVIVISHMRLDLLEQVVESVTGADEFLVVGDSLRTNPRYAHYPQFDIRPLANNTVDALVKRDAGTVATTSEYICYLSDDHKLAPDFVKHFRERYAGGEWDILVPSRYTVRNQTIYALPVGKEGEVWTTKPYAAGHCGIFKREWIRKLPWTAGPHHRNWDALHSHLLVEKGARLVFAGDDLAVVDIEPHSEPWRA